MPPHAAATHDDAPLDPAAYLPHAPPMVWLTDLVGPRPEGFVARVRLAADCLLADAAGHVPVWAGLEYMAQTMAAAATWQARAAASDVASAVAPRRGLLIACRQGICAVDTFRVGQVLDVVATPEYADARTARYACTIRDSATHATLVVATLTAWHPPDDAS